MEDIFPKDLYHSYVVESDEDETSSAILDLLEVRGEIEKNSPDVLFEKYESLGMSDTSKIKEWHCNKAVGNKKKICILKTKFINREAEQSLLKIIEEPQINTHFFIIIPDSKVLLNTLLSRVQIVKIKNSSIERFPVTQFLKMSKKDRIAEIANFIKENKDEENSGNLRYFATSFINEIEKHLYKEFKKNKDNSNIKFGFKELEKSRDYLKTPGASVKMILEHLALVI